MPHNPSPVRSRKVEENLYAIALRDSVIVALATAVQGGLNEEGFAAASLTHLASEGRGAAIVAVGTLTGNDLVRLADRTVDDVRWTSAIEANVLDNILDQRNRVNEYHEAQLIATFRNAQLGDVSRYLSNGILRPQLDLWAAENFTLIRSIPPQFHERLRQRFCHRILVTRPKPTAIREDT